MKMSAYIGPGLAIIDLRCVDWYTVPLVVLSWVG